MHSYELKDRPEGNYKMAVSRYLKRNRGKGVSRPSQLIVGMAAKEGKDVQPGDGNSGRRIECYEVAAYVHAFRREEQPFTLNCT